MSARPYGRILGANDRVGLGIIGLGRRGTIVGSAFLEDKRAGILAVCDIYDAQTKAFLSLLPKDLPPPHTSVAYQELLSRTDVDAVLISTPDHLHVTMAKAALEAGKHVYLEKPTLHRWEDRAILIDAAEKHKQVVQCGMQQRSGAHYLHVKQSIFAEKKLGHVLFARAVWHNFPWQQRLVADRPKPPGLDWARFLGPAPQVPYETVRYSSWRYFPDYGAGLLADILTHWIDVAQWMLDDAQPRNATALGGIYQLHDQRQNPDTVSAIVQYDGWNLKILNRRCFPFAMTIPQSSSKAPKARSTSRAMATPLPRIKALFPRYLRQRAWKGRIPGILSTPSFRESRSTRR
jgi:predicted dehydrogenase